MLKYGKNIKFNPDNLDPHHIDRQSTDLVLKNSRVLEIGCATGFVGEYLKKKKKCYVAGVEIRREEAKEATKKLDKVMVGDIEDSKVVKNIKKMGEFDVIFTSALIEHLRDPWSALLTWKKFLKKDGVIILTTSNITHWSMRLKMMKGDFYYEEYGILDNTHLRFFNVYSFKKLLVDCGYKIEHFSIDSVGGGYPKISFLLGHIFPNIFAYQMVIMAKPT